MPQIPHVKSCSDIRVLMMFTYVNIYKTLRNVPVIEFLHNYSLLQVWLFAITFSFIHPKVSGPNQSSSSEPQNTENDFFYPSPHRVTNYFLVIRTLKIYSLSNFQIYNTVLLIIVIMRYITSPGLILWVEFFTFWQPSPMIWMSISLTLPKTVQSSCHSRGIGEWLIHYVQCTLW